MDVFNNLGYASLNIINQLTKFRVTVRYSARSLLIAYYFKYLEIRIASLTRRSWWLSAMIVKHYRLPISSNTASPVEGGNSVLLTDS